MFTNNDIEQIKQRGIDPEVAQQQVERFKKGFPFMELVKPSIVNDGIIKLPEDEVERCIAKYDAEINNYSTVKFVPASGAATRMFKDLYAFLNEAEAGPRQAIDNLNSNKVASQFIKNIKQFAFYHDLKTVINSQGDSLEELIENKEYTKIVSYTLRNEGLNYGALPKALIKFHPYKDYSRAALEEHLLEGALYAKNGASVVNLHFTVSEAHMEAFKNYIQQVIAGYEDKFEVRYAISYSTQDKATDTIAVNLENLPFRETDETILFRPGGHGALLKNLSELNEDIIIIKNIDNIHHDRFIDTTVRYKKALAGLLIDFKETIHDYLIELEHANEYSDSVLEEIQRFVENDLCIIPPSGFDLLPREERITFLFDKLNRPIRVCGMVSSDTDTGGGPYWCVNSDDSVSLQIVETAQMNIKNPDTMAITKTATHFNPVDIACYTKDYNGNKFDLMNFRDLETGFISKKSKDGKDLKALELPGLWNGSMADWITIMVDTPFITFNPVKTVADLLKPEHQPA